MVIWKCTDVFGGIFRLGGRGLEEGDMLGNFPWRNLSWGKKIFMKGVQDYLAFFKKYNEKINMKKSFQLKVRRSIKI